MNPKHLETYVESLHKTLESKLFFTKILDEKFFDNKIVVDFGCGDGAVLKHIHYNSYNCLLVAVDANPNMLKLVEQQNIGAYLFSSLEEASNFIKERSFSDKEVVCIATSVLHEINDFQNYFRQFCKEVVDYVIIRDMYVLPKVTFGRTEILLSKIISGAHPKYLSDFISRYGYEKEALIHYLLKYTYVENWECEITENYLSVDWKAIEKLADKVLFNKEYIQPWRQQQVKKDFDIDISEYTFTTHREIIFKVKKGE